MASPSNRRHSSRTIAPKSKLQVSDLLLESLQVLAEKGEIEQACRLSGRAYALLRISQPHVARHFDVFLHRQIPRLTWTVPPERHRQSASQDPAIVARGRPCHSNKRSPE